MMKTISIKTYFQVSVVALIIGGVLVGAGQGVFNLPDVMKSFQWNVLIIAVGMSLFTTILAGTGFMSRTAVKFAQLSQGKPLWIMPSYALLLFSFSAFYMSNTIRSIAIVVTTMATEPSR